MEFPTGQNILAEHWNDSKQKAERTKEASAINGVLTTVKGDVNKAVSQLQISQAPVTLENIRSLVKGEAVEVVKTFLKIAQEHNDNFEMQIGKKYSQGSFKNYKTTLKYLKEFVPIFFKKNDVPLKSINFKFCEAYFTYLTTEKNCNVNGANKQMQRVKKILNYAIKSGYLQSNPMATYNLEFTPVHKVALTLEEINRLEGLDLKRPVLKSVRDVFLLQCYTGLSYSDIKLLTSNDVQAGDNGSHWIRMKRQKTGISFAVPLLPMAMTLIDRYLLNSEGTRPLLPVISNQKMNENLKVLQELAAISKNLTSHLGRHSFATTITLNNGVPISTVSRMLGHTKLSTTQIYAKVLEGTIDEDMRLLSERLKVKKQ